MKTGTNSCAWISKPEEKPLKYGSEMVENKKDAEKAVALRYDKQKEKAPRILAKGQGLVAKRIIDKAQEHGIAVYQDDDLVQVLSALELDTEIPGELYRAVAEVMVFVYKLNGKKL